MTADDATAQPAAPEPAAEGATDVAAAKESFSQAVRRSAFGQVAPGEAPTGRALLAAMGGIRGLVESILPGLVFLVLYTITGQVAVSVLVPFGIAVLFVIARAVLRQPWRMAVGGILLLGVSAGLSLLTGRAEDNFVLGFGINGAFLAALLVSLVVRWPLIGVFAGLITGDEQWRADAAKRRGAVVASWLWVGLFSLRLAVEVPLYLAGNAAALAALKLILGVPLYAAVLWVTWLIMRAVWSKPPEPR